MCLPPSHTRVIQLMREECYASPACKADARQSKPLSLFFNVQYWRMDWHGLHTSSRQKRCIQSKGKLYKTLIPSPNETLSSPLPAASPTTVQSDCTRHSLGTLHFHPLETFHNEGINHRRSLIRSSFCRRSAGSLRTVWWCYIHWFHYLCFWILLQQDQ
jgi:hypothetical protein